MASKRIVTLLLALCLVVSLMAPAMVTAAPAASQWVVDSKIQQTQNASGQTSSMLVNGSNLSGPNSLRGQTASNNNTNQTVQNGSWQVTPSDEVPAEPIVDSQLPEAIQALREAAEHYRADEMVSAFVVMEEAPLVEEYSSIGSVPAAETEELTAQQDELIQQIQKEVLEGGRLNVTHRYTYLTNAIVVSTAFGNLEEIAALPGVKTVFLTPVFYPCETEDVTWPSTVSSGDMSDVPYVWNNDDLGFTGKGMTIAVLDTGLDTDHPSFAADPALGTTSWTVEYLESKLSGLNAAQLLEGLTAEDLYRSAKVPFAFNYGATEESELLNVDHTDGVGDHGTHVAGISAANNVEGSNVIGMAPDAQIVVMKVFSPSGGAYMYDILNALEDAMYLGCDVANLSLGSAAGFSSLDPEIDAVYERIAETDIIVNIAAGNEGTSSYDNMPGTDLNPTTHPDNATVSSPSTYVNAMSVASVDNALVEMSFFTLGETKIGYNDGTDLGVTFAALAGQELEYVLVPGLGEAADFEGLDLTGKVAVIARGTINFSTKLANAEAAGAVAVIITNNEPGSILYFGMSFVDENDALPEGVSGTVPCVMISMEDGAKLAAAEDKTIVVSAEAGMVPDAGGGQLSSFSSWGVAPDLKLVPDIAGVGGNVYSCYDNGEYGFMSGTSMATPQVAGVTALVLQYLKETYPTLTDAQTRVMAESLLMSTAVPVVATASGVEASPRQQGAGLVNALNAVTSGAYLTVDGCTKPKAQLGDNDTGVYTFTFQVHNFSTEAKTYTLRGTLLTEDYVTYYDVDYMAGYDTALSGTVSFDKNTVTVAAGTSASVTVTVTLSDADKEWFKAHYPNGGYVEGYIYAETEDGVDLSLPYLGFYGDWAASPLFDTEYWYESSFWGLAYPDGLEYYHVMWTSLLGSSWVLGFNPYMGAVADTSYEMIYNPAYNTVSPNGDGVVDAIDDIYLSLMRNAQVLTFTYYDEAGDVVHVDEINYVSKTMYNSNYGQVVPFLSSWYMYNWDFTDDETGEVLPSGTRLNLVISGKVDYEGAQTQYMETIPLLIDTTAPVPTATQETSEEGRNYVTLTVQEDALAAAYLYNPQYTRQLGVYFGYDLYYDGAIGVPNGDIVDNGDGTFTLTMDVTDMGSEMLLVLCDYGGNESYWDLTYSLENDPEMDETALYAYRVYDATIYDDSAYGWITIDKTTAETTQLTNDMYEYYSLTAAEYVDEYVFAVDAGGNFVVMKAGLWNRTEIRNIGINALDMAFDTTTDTLYLAGSFEDEYGYKSYGLFTIDPLTGDTELLRQYDSQYQMPYAMTFVDGTLYAAKYYTNGLYTVDMETYDLTAVKDAEGNNLKLNTSSGGGITPYYNQSMTYSEADGKIYWAYFDYSYRSELFVIDVSGEVPTYTATAFPVSTEAVGLLTLEDTGYELPVAEELEKLVLSEDSLLLQVGEGAMLEVSPLPWTVEVEDGDIVWASSNAAIAAVDQDGVVYGLSEGYAVITATCGDVVAYCPVTVVKIEGDLYFYNYYNGTGDYGDWMNLNLESGELTSFYYSPVDFVAADYNGHDGYIYGYDIGGHCYRMDPATGVAEELGIAGNYPWDMAYDYSTGLMYAITVDTNMYTTTLNYVNMRTGELVEVATVYDVYLTLACDTEGGLYAMSAEGVLYYLYLYETEAGGGGFMPLAEDEAELVTMIEPVYITEGFGSMNAMQSMCFDHNNGVLLWANPETTSIVWINPFATEPQVVYLGDPTGSGVIQYVGLFVEPEEVPELAYTPVESLTASDMLLLVGSEKNPAVSVEPLNATNQDMTLVSADESIAKITEKGWILGVAEGTTTVTATLVDGEDTLSVTFTVAVKNSSDNIYGHVLTDFYYGSGQIWAEIPDTNPAVPNYLAYTDYTIYAEELLDGKLYAYGYDPYDWEANWLFMVIDPETFEIESMTDMGDGFPFVYDMTFDYTSGTMYAVAGYNDSSSDLYMVDLESGEVFLVMETEPFFTSLAAAPDGTLYGISASVEEYDPMSWSSVFSNAMLYKFDIQNGTYETVMDTGVKCNMLASMAFDYDNGNLYWTPVFRASYWDNPTSGLYLLDIENQAAYNMGSIGMAGSQVVGLYIVADEYPEIPDLLQNAILTSTSEILAVEETVELGVFLQPAGLEDVEITWSSNDEAVATVDENGVVTAVAPGVATVTVTVKQGDTVITRTCAIVVLGEDDRILTYNRTQDGWTSLSRVDTLDYTQLTEGEEETDVRAAALIGGVIFGYDEDNKFFTATKSDNYARKYLGEANVEIEEDTEAYDFGFVVRDLAYDAANGRLLAVGCKDVVETYEWYGEVYETWYELYGGCAIYEVDMTNGQLTELCVLTDAYGDCVSNMYTLTVDGNGTVYTYSSYDDYVSTVDMETGAITQITTFQNQGIYGDSDGAPMAMEYDPITGMIYMLFTTNGNYYYLYTFNPNNGQLTQIGTIGETVYNQATWTTEGELFATLMIDAEHEHSWSEWTTITPSTETEPGLAEHHCLLCGAVETAEIPAGATSPDTGDHFDLTLMIVLLALSAVALVAVVIIGRKRRNA